VRMESDDAGLQSQTSVKPGELPKTDGGGGLNARRRRLPVKKRSVQTYNPDHSPQHRVARFSSHEIDTDAFHPACSLLLFAQKVFTQPRAVLGHWLITDSSSDAPCANLLHSSNQRNAQASPQHSSTEQNEPWMSLHSSSAHTAIAHLLGLHSWSAPHTPTGQRHSESQQHKQARRQRFLFQQL